MSTPHIFKRKVDKQIIAGWVLAFILPFPWTFFSLFGLFTRPDNTPYFIFIILTPITLSLSVITLLSLLRMSTTVFVIDENRIAKQDFLFKKNYFWSDIADVEENTVTVNGIQTARSLSIKDHSGKKLISFPCPTNKSFMGESDLTDTLISFFNNNSQQRIAQIEKTVSNFESSGSEGVIIYKLHFFIKMALHLILVLVLFGEFEKMFVSFDLAEAVLNTIIAVVVIYLVLINLHSRYELSKGTLKYKNIFQKEIKIPWSSIKHITHNSGITNNIILETRSKKIKLRGIILVGSRKLVNEISLRRQIARKKNKKNALQDKK